MVEIIFRLAKNELPDWTYGGIKRIFGQFKLDRGQELKSAQHSWRKKQKKYEDYLEKIKDYVAVTWEYGRGINDMEELELEEIEDLSVEDEKSKLRSTLWNLEVEKYAIKL